MITVSIEVPPEYKEGFKPLLEMGDRFVSNGILVGFDLKTADLRIMHQQFALEELAGDGYGRLRTPTIVYERIDGALVHNETAVRALMQHEDVKLWLKRNTFRDFRLNNESFLYGNHHFRLLNELPRFHMDVALDACALPVTEQMAAKIRLTPIAFADWYKRFRDATIDWTERRPIDVFFAGLVNYEVRGYDYWDEKFTEAQAATFSGPRSLPIAHRREAVRVLAELRHLRTLIGMNRAVQDDIYSTLMLRSSISVSPWGLGEYGLRDYKSILAGCIMVKPRSDHIRTFDPDVYQDGKFYVACRPDFADLPDIIEDLMTHRARSIELARAAREAMLEAHAPDRVHRYFTSLFREALGERGWDARAASGRGADWPAISLATTPMAVVRAAVRPVRNSVTGLATKETFLLVEDDTPQNSHDIRLIRDEPTPSGLYRLTIVIRKRQRNHIVVELNRQWQEKARFGIDLDTAHAQAPEVTGQLFIVVHEMQLKRLAADWVACGVGIRLTETVFEGLLAVVYAADESGQLYYDGRGCEGFELAKLALTRIELLDV